MRLVLLQRRHADGEALTLAGARLDELDEAVDVDGTRLPLQHGCTHGFGAQLAGSQSERHRQQRGRRKRSQSVPPEDEMHRQRRRRRQRGGDGPRLERQQEIERDAAAEHHRQPEKPAVLLGFEVASEEPQERQLPRRRTWRQPGDAQGPRLDSAHLRHRTHPAAAPAARGRRYSGARPAYGAHRRQAPSHSPAVAEGQLCGLRRPSRPSSA